MMVCEKGCSQASKGRPAHPKGQHSLLQLTVCWPFSTARLPRPAARLCHDSQGLVSLGLIQGLVSLGLICRPISLGLEGPILSWKKLHGRSTWAAERRCRLLSSGTAHRPIHLLGLPTRNGPLSEGLACPSLGQARHGQLGSMRNQTLASGADNSSPGVGVAARTAARTGGYRILLFGV
jgi:hypothetical protein